MMSSRRRRGSTRCELRDALREAVAHHVLASQFDGRIAFRHALLREAVYDDLLPGEHRRAAPAPGPRAGGAAAPARRASALDQAAEIAHHFDAAGDQPAALRTAIRAALTAERVHAEGEAAVFYERALVLWDRVDDPEALAGCDHVDLLARAANAHQFDYSRCIHLLKRALRRDRPGAPSPAAPRCCWSASARRAGTRGKGQIALEAWDAALALLPVEPPSEERAQLLAAKAGGLMLWGRYARRAARWPTRRWRSPTRSAPAASGSTRSTRRASACAAAARPRAGSRRSARRWRWPAPTATSTSCCAPTSTSPTRCTSRATRTRARKLLIQGRKRGPGARPPRELAGDPAGRDRLRPGLLGRGRRARPARARARHAGHDARLLRADAGVAVARPRRQRRRARAPGDRARPRRALLRAAVARADHRDARGPGAARAQHRRRARRDPDRAWSG